MALPVAKEARSQPVKRAVGPQPPAAEQVRIRMRRHHPNRTDQRTRDNTRRQISRADANEKTRVGPRHAPEKTAVRPAGMAGLRAERESVCSASFVLYVLYGSRRQPKNYSPVIILLASRVQIEIRESDLARAPGCEIKQCAAHNRVISHFQQVSIIEDQDSGLLRSRGTLIAWRILRSSLRLVRGGNVPHRGNVGIGARSPPVEYGGSALIIGVASRLCVVRRAVIDFVWHRDRVYPGHEVLTLKAMPVSVPIVQMLIVQGKG